MSFLLGTTVSVPVYLADTVALAAVALIGYLCGQRSRGTDQKTTDEQLLTEVTRATQIAKELQDITRRIRQDVAFHQSNITQFKTRLCSLRKDGDMDGWTALSSEAESLLVPTMKLATDLSLAYDQLRTQSGLLMNFAGSRTDPETGLHNRRALEEQLEILFSLLEQNQSRFSVALFSVDCPPGESPLEQQLVDFAKVLYSCARDTDIVARYSTEEFVVVMPQTSLAGATIFSERLLRRANQELHCIVAGGIVEVHSRDNAQSLLSRADSALYSARSHGQSCLYQHNGKSIRAHEVDLSNAATNTSGSSSSEASNSRGEECSEEVLKAR